jgi:aminoglycoside/choline kinase family phosphotransferase
MRALRSRVRSIWQARETLLQAVESAPQTLVHLDFWPTNLIAADDGTTVAVDWSQIGIGAVGQDIDQLTLDPVWMQVLPDASLDELQTHVLRGYASGLRSSGFIATEADLNRWYAAAAGARYVPMAAFQARRAADPDHVANSETRHGLPYAVIAGNHARVVKRAVELAESVLDGG